MSGDVTPALPAERLTGLQGKRIVITGASGWIGRTALDLLLSVLGPERFAAQVHAFGSAARDLEVGPGVIARQRPLTELAELEPEETILLHLAYLTKDRAEVMDENAYISANLQLRQQVLAALDAIDVMAVFVASSGAAYREDDPDAPSAMRSYGKLKREDEDAFSAWAQERQRRAVICRIFSVSGPFINKPETYALASFILDALAGRPITIKAKRPVFRSYVAVRELLTLVFTLLTEASEGVVRFDSGGKVLEMEGIAAKVAELISPVPVQRESFDAGLPADMYVGASEPYRELLASCGLESLPFEQQVLETAAYLRQSRSGHN